MSKKRLLIIIGLVVLSATTGYWIYHLKIQKAKEAAAALTEIVQVERRDLSETVEGDGEVVFSKNGGIYPAYAATVQKIYCQAGSKVKKGDLLMVLTSDTLKSDWVDTEYDYKKAKINLELARKELERQETLFKAQATTVDDLESAQNTVDLDRAALNQANSKLQLITQTTDKANYIGGDHRTILIRAPFNGEVAWVEVRPGQTVSAIGSNSNDSSSENLLLYLVAENSLEVEATVDETDINQVKPGQTAKVILNDTDQTELTGTVTQVGAYGTDDSGVIVFPVRIRLDGVKVALRPQMTADISIYITSKRDVLAIPSAATLNIRGKTMVNKVAGKRTELTEVELGVKNATYVEVLAGLAEGDRIMVEQSATQTQDSQNTRSDKKSQMMGGPGGPPM